jgi:hypothetical protein
MIIDYYIMFHQVSAFMNVDHKVLASSRSNNSSYWEKSDTRISSTLSSPLKR